jgi:signal transduction histidine kinase
MRSLAREINGQITIDSSPGNGTIVRVVVPVGEDHGDG